MPAAAIFSAPARPSGFRTRRCGKTIAERMLEAGLAAPDIHVAVDVRVDKFAATREFANKQLAAEKIKLSMGDFVTKAAAPAPRKHPGVNASYEADAIVQHGSEVNVGIAVALGGGLMVPRSSRMPTSSTLRETRLRGPTNWRQATRDGTPARQMMGGRSPSANLGDVRRPPIRRDPLNLPEVGDPRRRCGGEKPPVVEGDCARRSERS